ncbi:PA3496 family putative envelope integrity protein [Pseudomonas sp.]|uniref:PA3496 family putative envelope integrity protein n=1 Tax=Pseudomonas sp. TaxID=306 RepID=UPI003A96B96B
MSRYVDESQPYASSQAKARRKLVDQRRMEYRRAIESYSEQRLLQQELSDYPELIAANYIAASRELGRAVTAPAH